MADGQTTELKMGVDYFEKVLGDIPGPQALIEAVNDSASIIPTMLEGTIPVAVKRVKDAVDNGLPDSTHQAGTVGGLRVTPKPKHTLQKNSEIAKEVLAKAPMRYSSEINPIPSANPFKKRNRCSQSFTSNGATIGSGYTNLKPLMPSAVGWSGSHVLSPKVKDEQVITLTLEPIPHSSISVSNVRGNQDLLMRNILNAGNVMKQNATKQTKWQEHQKYPEKWKKFSSYIPAKSASKFFNNPAQMLYSKEIPRHAVIGRNITEVFLESKYPASDALANVARSTSVKNSLKRKHHDVNDIFVRYLNRPKWARHDPHVMICKSEFKHSCFENSSPSVMSNTRNGMVPWPSDKIPLVEYAKVRKKTPPKFPGSSCRFKTRNLSKYRIAKPKHVQMSTTSKLQMKNLLNKRPSAFNNFSSNAISKRNQFVPADRLTWDSRAKKFAFPSSTMGKTRLPKMPCFSFPTALSQQRSKFSKPLNSAQNYRVLHKPKATNRFIPTAQRPRPAFSQARKSNTNKVSIQPQKLHDLNEILKCTSVPDPGHFRTMGDYFRAVALFQAKNLLVAKALARGQCVSDEQDPNKVGSSDKIVGKLCSIVKLLAAKNGVCPYSFVLLNAHTEDVFRSWETSLQLFRAREHSVVKENDIKGRLEQEKHEPAQGEKVEWFYNSETSCTEVPGNEMLSSSKSPGPSFQASLAWLADEFHEEEEEAANTPPRLMLPALSPQRVLHCETRSPAKKRELEKLDLNHNVSAPPENEGIKLLSKTPYCQTKVTSLRKKEGCICKQKRSQPPPSYCVRFRRGFCLPDCCSDRSLWVNCLWYAEGCPHCQNSSSDKSGVKSTTNSIVNHNGDVEQTTSPDFNWSNGSRPREIGKGERVVHKSDGTHKQESISLVAQTNVSENGNEKKSHDEVPPLNGDAASPVHEEVCRHQRNLDSNDATVLGRKQKKNGSMLGDDLDTEFFEQFYGKRLEELAKIAWESGSFLPVNDKHKTDSNKCSISPSHAAADCSRENHKVQQSFQGKINCTGEKPKGARGRENEEDFAVIENCEAKIHEKVVGQERHVSPCKKEEEGSAPVHKANHCHFPNISEGRFEEERKSESSSLLFSSRSRKDLNAQVDHAVIGCDTNSNGKHMGATHAERHQSCDLSPRKSDSLTAKSKDKSETRKEGNLPYAEKKLTVQSYLQSDCTGLSSEFLSPAVHEKNEATESTDQSVLGVVKNEKMGREGIEKDSVDMACSSKQMVNSVYGINSFKFRETKELAIRNEPDRASNPTTEVLKQNEECKSGSSVRLRSKRTATKRGRYEDDYVTDLPKNSKKVKKAMPCRDYDQDKFWHFYRKCRDEEHSKNLVLRHRYIKFFMENDINCKTLSFTLASNAFTCAAPSLQYASNNQPRPPVPESGFVPFMRSFTKTRKPAHQPLKPKKDDQCPYCGRFFTKEPRTVLDTHIARHNMGQWKILAAPKQLVRKKKRKHQRKAPPANTKSTPSQSTVVFVDPVKSSKKVGNVLESKTLSAKAPLNASTATSMAPCGSSELEKLKTIKAFPRPSNISMGHRKQTARKSFSNLARNLSKENLIAALTASSNSGKLQSIPFKPPLKPPETNPVRKLVGNGGDCKNSDYIAPKKDPEQPVKALTTVHKIPHEQSSSTDASAMQPGSSDTKHVTKPLQKDHRHHRRRSIGISKYANSIESPTQQLKFVNVEAGKSQHLSNLDAPEAGPVTNNALLDSKQNILDKP